MQTKLRLWRIGFNCERFNSFKIEMNNPVTLNNIPQSRMRKIILQ
jgi:hypothetical protein